jgi:hypothetical protein
MKALINLGYKIYRLSEAKEIEEFLLYDIKKKNYNCFSKKRLFDIFKKILETSNFDFMKFAEITNQKISKEKVVETLIEENYLLINNFGYKPTNCEIFEEDNRILFNVYNKSDFLINFFPNDDLDFPYIKELINNLVGNNEDDFNWFCKWIAFIIQNPLKKLATGVILQGEQGTGKTQFCNLILKNLFESNFIEIGQVQIDSEWNDYLQGKQLIVGNEVIYNENRFTVPDKIKNYMTDEYISINRRFKNTLTLRNYSHWILTTNNQVPIKIDDGDRRWSVFKSKKLDDGWNLIKNLKANLYEELIAFTTYLLQLNIDYEEVDKPIMNEHKKEIIRACQNNVLEFYDEAQNVGGFSSLQEEYGTNFNLEIYFANNKNVIIGKNLYNFYKFYCSENQIKSHSRFNFTRFLKLKNIDTKVYLINGKSERCYSLN